MPRTIRKTRRSRTSCSLIALATVLAVGASPASAQSLLGTGTYVTNPNATGITTGVNTTTINLNGGNTIINWVPADNATGTGTNILFQPAGTTANFVGAGDFAVLNRVMVADATRAIVMNGTVNATVGGSQRGSVYFYSPGGFIFGGGSVFNVGSLVITTLPISDAAFTAIGTGFGQLEFGQATNVNSTISMSGTVNANYQPLGVPGPSDSSYVAMVAPRVIHNGTITANGSTALVAAEAATINFTPDGLFDIQVTVGSTSSSGVEVYGDITGPTPTGAADQQRIYLVAVPKNDAMTMVIGNGADLGFTLANTAVDDNGVIVLSAGHDIVDGAIGARSAGHGANATGNFWFTGAHAANNLVGEATGDANLYSVSPNLTTTFNNDVTVHAANNLNMGVSGVGTTLTVGGDLNLSANRTGTAGQSVTAGNVQLYALNSGSLSVAGATSLTANATGGNASSGSAGNGTGGTIFINTDDGGSLSLQALTASANGTGGNGTAANINAGSGTGGTVSMYADSASGLVANGATSLIAQGSGGNASGTGLAGNGTGGTARIYIGDNSSLTFNSNVGLVTNGTGGSSSGSSNGGTGMGGSSRITAVLGSTGGGLVTINGTASLSANGTGGSSSSGAGGAGIGGVTRMYSTAHHYVINGSAFFSAVGDGGNSGSATGGTGRGGTAEIVSEGSEIDISGNVVLDSPGYGGGGLTGGDGLGGAVNIISENDISVAGDVLAFAEGEGAQGNGGNGGYGEGGVIDVTANGGDLSFGELTAVVFGRGGDDGGLGTAAGDGQGGSIFINALNGGGLSITNHVFAIAEAYGGRHGLNVTGGSGTGGYVELLAAGTGSQINIGGNVELNALAYGQYSDCSSCSGTGGDAFGGSVYVAADGADIAIGGDLLAEANAEGGDMDSGGTTGSGFGGDVAIRALTNGSLGITGSLTATADGLGGGNFGFGTNTGSGTGGDVFLQASGANANITVGSYATVTANGESGPFCGECGGGGLAGNGTGGSVTVQAFGASTASLTIDGSLDAEANGRGGDAISGNGGTGEGGSVYLGANDGADVHVLGSLSASAEGWGGYSYGPGDGGQGIGGSVTLAATTGGTLEIDGGGYIDADGYGGGAGISSSGDGGDGTGGVAGIYGDGGAIDIGLLLFASAEGHGGYSDNAAGGDGVGTLAEVVANNGGSVSIDGFLSLSVDGFGGTGITGGTGTGGGIPNEDGGGTDGAHIFARNGAVTVTGTTNLSADGFGGSGASGGVGGSGFGGWSTIHAGNSDNGPSNITLAAVNISANATGGSGGQGLSGNQGGDGGAGGDATAGSVGVLANAGNGHLLVTNVSANAIATGGHGGDGGNGDNLAGGNGGAGGNAEGGFVTVGTASGNNQAAGSNLGTATFTSITADSSAVGGNGGAGNFGNPDGSGGAGGIGDGGSSLLLVRGSTVSVSGTTTLTSNGTGGDGGFGGGDGFAGEVHVLATSRFMIPEQQGTLNTGAIVGTATGTGGDGAVDGAGIVEGGSGFVIDRSTADIGSLDFTIGGEDVAPGSDPSRIAITNATVTVGTIFNFETIGDLSFYVDNGSFSAGTLALSAANFVFDPDSPAPTNLGTTYATTALISTGGDFVADANWDVTNTFVVDAPGLIDLDNVVGGNGIDFSAGGSIDIESIDAGTYVDLLAGGSIDIFGPLAAGSYVVASAGTDLTFTTLDAGGFVDLMAGANITGTSILAGGSISLQAGGDIGLGGATSSFGGIVMAAGDDISLAGDLLADGDILLTAGGDIVGGNMESGQDITLAAPGTITALDINAGGIFMALAHGDMSFGDATASEVFLSDYAMVTAGGVITAACVGTCGMSGADGVVTASPTGSPYAFVTTDGGVDGAGQLPGEGGTNGSVYTTSEFTVAAGDDLEFWFNYVTSDGSGFADYAWAALLNSDLTPVAILYTARTQPSGTIVPGFDLPGVEATLNPASVPIIDGAPTWSPLGGSSGSCYDAGCGYTGWVNSTYDISQAGNYILQFGVSNWTDTGFQSGMAFSSLSIGGVAVAPVLLTRTGGSISIGNVNTGQFSAAAGTSLTTGLISSSGDINLDAAAAITTGNLTAGDFVLANGGSITTGNIDADSVAMTSTGGDIATGNIIAFGAVDLDAFGDILAGNITGGSIDLLAGDDIATGNLTTQFLAQVEQEGGAGPQKLFPGASVTLESGGDIATGNIDSIDGVYADAGGSLATGTIDAVDFVNLFAVGDIATGNITAGDQILVVTDASMTLGNLVTDQDVDLEAGGSATFGNANVGTEFDFDVGGNVTGGDIVAGIEIGGEGAGGNVVLGNLTAGFGEGEPDDDTFSVGFQAGSSITVGNVNGAQRVGFAAQGDLTTGSITSGWDFMAFSEGNIVTGAITTGEDDQVYISGSDVFLAAGGGSEQTDFDPDIALGLDPDPTGGSITINGPVSTGQFDAAAGTSLTTQAITATGDIHASAGGTATLNGVWNTGGDVNLASNNIDITGSGGISADGDVGLFSTNATQALIGDGLTGTGYALSNAEFGRISGTNVGIGARGDASAAIDMLIGDLTVTGPLVGSTVEGADGILAFAVGDIDSETIGGVIRVNGNVAATGFGPANAIEFHADRFELNAATGSVSILSSGTTLGGELGIYADRIHVAEASILDQLAANPTYTGYQEDLNEAASVQRPDGVLRADTLWIESDNLQSVLIQNTGSFETRAGFLVREAFINDDEEVAGPPGSINLVVNGQVVTEGGTLTGVAVRDALVDEETDITPFTSNSTINGCPLTGACIIAPPPPPPTANLVENQIDLIGRNPIGENEFEDNQEGEEGSSNPIAPPQPLFDTRPLVPSGDVNDPVSGTGNPALLGSEGQCEEEENGQCAAPVDGEGQ